MDAGAEYTPIPSEEIEKEFVGFMQDALYKGQMGGLDKAGDVLRSWPGWTESILEKISEEQADQISMARYKAVRDLFDRTLAKRKCSPQANRAEQILREGMDLDAEDTRRRGPETAQGGSTPILQPGTPTGPPAQPSGLLRPVRKGEFQGKGAGGKSKMGSKGDKGSKGGKGKNMTKFGMLKIGTTEFGMAKTNVGKFD